MGNPTCHLAARWGMQKGFQSISEPHCRSFSTAQGAPIKSRPFIWTFLLQSAHLCPTVQQKISFPSISFEEEYPEQYAYKGKDDESLRIFQHVLWLKMRSSYQIFTISGVDNSLSKNLNYITMKCTLAQSMCIKSLRRVVVQMCVLFIPVHRTLLLLQSCQKIYNACETAGLLPVHTLQTLSLLQGCPV